MDELVQANKTKKYLAHIVTKFQDVLLIKEQLEGPAFINEDEIQH